MVYIGVGTNLGDRLANLTRAVELLNAEGIQVLRQSSIYESAPRDVLDQPWFVNMVVECETRFFPMQLLAKLLAIERAMGRNRKTAVRRGPRIIDLDILLYQKAVIETERLTVPHAALLERRFVLEPLLELDPQLRLPGTGVALAKALPAVRDQQVEKLSSAS